MAKQNKNNNNKGPGQKKMTQFRPGHDPGDSFQGFS